MWRYISIAMLCISLLGGGMALAYKIELRREQEKRIVAEARLQYLHMQAIEQATSGAKLAVALQSEMSDLQGRLEQAKRRALNDATAGRADRKEALVSLILSFEGAANGELEQGILR